VKKCEPNFGSQFQWTLLMSEDSLSPLGNGSMTQVNKTLMFGMFFFFFLHLVLKRNDCSGIYQHFLNNKSMFASEYPESKNDRGSISVLITVTFSPVLWSFASFIIIFCNEEKWKETIQEM
jgi:hypothetical protein